MVKSVAVIKILAGFLPAFIGFLSRLYNNLLYIFIYIYIILYIHIYIYKVAYLKRPLTFSAIFLKIVWEMFSSAATTALII